ncbi:hypothetical protein NXY56_005005 [Leishmania guyanensis]
MDAEVALTFVFHPSTDIWTSEAHLRVNVEAVGGHDGSAHCDAAGRALGGCAALSSSAASSCTLLIYVSRHHTLRRVFVQEEDDATESFTDEVPGATAVLSSSSDAMLGLSCKGSRLSRCIEVQHYSWEPCRRPIRHHSTSDREAAALAMSSDSRRRPSRGEKVIALTHRHGETETTSVGAGTSPSSHPHVFSSSSTAFPEGMLDDEEDEDGGGGGRLVLQFDSSSSPPPSSPLSALRSEVAVDDIAPLSSTNGVKGVKKAVTVEATPSAEILSAHVGATAAPRISNAATAASTNATLNKAATENVEGSVSNAPRRLLLLRPGTDGAPCSLSTPSSMGVQPGVPLSATLDSSRGGRVLNINTVTSAKTDALSAVRIQEAPRTALPPSLVAPTTRATEAKKRAPNVAAAVPPTTFIRTSAASGAPERHEWQPFLLSFAYPSGLTSATSTAQQAQPLPSAPTAMTGRRAVVAVHLEFTAVTFGEISSDADTALPVAPCSRGSVASCGWARQCRSRSILSPVVYSHDTARRTSHGYSIIVGDASWQSCCLMCPQVAAVLPEDNDCCCGTTCESAVNSGTGEVRAGPLLDVWVRAVSGRQLSAQQRRRCHRDTFPSSMEECMPNNQPQPQHGSVKLEGAMKDEGVCRVPAASLLSSEPSQPLFTAVFTASWLSQLCCVFTPPSIAMSPCRHPHTGDALWPRRARRSLWPSSRSSSLLWVATQVTQDCVVTHPRCLTDSTSAQRLCSSEVKGEVRYWWLRSDPRQSDVLHWYFCRVLACWASATAAPLATSSSHSCTSRCVANGAVEGSSLLDIIVTKANPPTLSLRGGAVGTTSSVLVAAETLHAAALEAEDAEEAPSTATAAPPVAAAGRRRPSPSALRARVAITAAVLQHLMWGAVARLSTSCTGETSRTGGAEWTEVSNSERRQSTPLPPQEQHVAHLEGMTSRLVCAARVLAVHWVCGSPSLLRSTPASLMDFLAEERLLLSSVLPVGRLLNSMRASSPKGVEACDPVKVPSTTGLDMLLHFESQYASASFAALAWLSQHAADIQLLRGEGFVSLRLHEAESLLLRSALALPESPQLGRLVTHHLHSGETSVFGLRSYTGEPHQRLPLDSGEAMVGLSAPQTPLRGTVNVRIEHAAVVNAFMVHLEWTTMMVAAACDTPAPAFSSGIHGAVELPFLLLVFVVEEDVRGVAHDSEDSSLTSGDDSFTGTGGVGGRAVRLYQVTPFSWRLGAAACAADGFTARTTQLVMHALDLVARRPDVFEGFHMEAIARFGSSKATTAATSARRRKTLKRTRGHWSGPDGADGTAERGACATTVSWKRAARVDTATVRRSGAPLRACKRRRTGVDARDVDRKGSEASGADEDGSSDVEVENDDASSPVLSAWSSRSFRAAAAAASPLDSTPAHRRRPDSGFPKNSGGRSLSVVDTARVVPVVVFREDAAAPLLEVVVSHASQLAAQLAAFGSRAAKSTRRSKEEEDEAQEEASRVLCALLDHWIGFSSLHAAAPQYIADLQACQRHGALAPITQLGNMSTHSSALTEPCVLHAYTGLLRSLWREFERLSPLFSHSVAASPLESSPFTRFVSLGVLRAHVLTPACVAAAIEAAIAEYVRQDIECRRRSLFAQRDAAFQWDSEEAEEDEKRESGARRGKPKKHTQQQRVQEELATEAAARATWASVATQMEALVRVFYAEVLGEYPRPSPLLQSDARSRALHGATEKAPLSGSAEGGVVPWDTPNSREIAASERRAAFQSLLHSLLQRVEAEGEGQPPPPQHGDSTMLPLVPTARLQLTGASTDKSTSLRTVSSSWESLQRRTFGAGDVADLNVTVAQLAEACVTQFLCAPRHSCFCSAGATSTNTWCGEKRVDKVAPRSVVGEGAAAQRAAQLLCVSDAFLQSRGEGTSTASVHRHVTTAKLALPLAQLMMSTEAVLH